MPFDTLVPLYPKEIIMHAFKNLSYKNHYSFTNNEDVKFNVQK